MKSYLPLLLLAASPCCAEFRLVEPGLQFRAGLDTNPAGTGGASATLLGSHDTFVSATGAGFALALADADRSAPALKVGYAAESWRFERWADENHTTHRFSLGGQLTAGAWKLGADGSSLYVDGSASTHLSTAAANANAVALWRERRRQWQHRLKLQAQTTRGALVLRGMGSLLAYDYLTDVVAGRVAFADRADFQAGLDAGWKPQSQSLWFTGLRVGRQTQGIVPLPNSAFDYANNYQRLAFGWEGKLPAGTSLSLIAGPDFRHYTGAIDPTVLLGGRDRTSLWFETSLTAKPHPAWTLTGKATRFAWLSSTGKSAYFDSAAEFAAAWAPGRDWSVRLSAKAHRCDYFPAGRDDWESFVGVGVTRKLSPRLQVSAEFLRHQAWNTLATATEREFRRAVITLGATLKL